MLFIAIIISSILDPERLLEHQTKFQKDMVTWFHIKTALDLQTNIIGYQN